MGRNRPGLLTRNISVISLYIAWGLRYGGGLFYLSMKEKRERFTPLPVTVR